MNDADCAALPEPPERLHSPVPAAPPDRLRSARVLLLSLLAPLACLAQALPADRPIACRVKSVSATRPVALLDLGRTGGLEVGDRALVLAEAGTSGLPAVLAAGEIIYLESAQAGLAWTPPDRRVPAESNVVVVPRGFCRGLGRTAPGGVYREARVDSGIPGTTLAWLDSGAGAGWRVADKVLVWRDAAPATWGEVVLTETDVALVRVRLGPAMLAPQRGDRVEQLGSAHDSYILRTAVTAVQSAGDGRVARLAGDEALGIALGDRIDFFRNGRYVGFGAVTLVAPNLWVEISEALSREPPQAGDVAYVRARAGSAARSRSGYVFRVEPDYVLVTLGEADGVASGDRLTLLGPDGARLQLTVSSVYPDHCGAEILAGGPAIGPEQLAWRRAVWGDLAEAPEEPVVQPVEAIPYPGAAWLYELRAPEQVLAVGDLVAPKSDPGALAAVVVTRGGHAWGVRVERLRHGGLE